MGQTQTGEKLPCEEERSEWKAANDRYVLREAELSKLTSGEKAARDISVVVKLSKEVETLNKEMVAKRQKYFDCLTNNSAGGL
jgi:hypothetical protein